MARQKNANGEGTLIKLKNGSWRAAVTIGRDSQGRQKKQYFYGQTRAEVQKKMIAALSAIHEGIYTAPSKFTLGQWLNTWLTEYSKPAIAASSYDNYRDRIKQLVPVLGHIKLKDLRPDMVQSFINKLHREGYSRSTINLCKTVLYSSLEQAVRNGLIPANPAANVVMPKSKPAEKAAVFTHDEQCRFVEAAKTAPLGEFYRLALATGCRRGELLALQWDNVNLAEGRIKITRTMVRVKGDAKAYTYSYNEPKTQASIRTIPLEAKAITLLKGIKRKQAAQRLNAGTAYKDENLVFADALGNHYSYWKVDNNLKKILKKAGIDKPMHMHSLRHSFATRGLESGIELIVMQKLLGHSSISTTADRYSHVLPNKTREAIQKLNNLPV